MKIIKENYQSLFIKSLGIDGKIYLTCSVFILFDLLRPDEKLTEQELWDKIPPLLGENNIIDLGIPKPRGEILITGSCYAPQQKPIPATQVSFEIGGLSKTLAVFGDRYWKLTPGGWIISNPKPFAKMPITWNNAFGGKTFKQNPLGKGIDKVILPNEQEVVPLPNIEDPNHLIGSPTDRPTPQSFGSIDLMWPQRLKKQGTYGDKWLKERWPHFPEDMNYEFFNMAPEDQFIDDFFHGNEIIRLINLHPNLPVIESKLPEIRVRCFVTKIKNFPPQKDPEEEFVEVKNKIDTLWLFPDIERGLLIYRGNIEIKDEEFADIKYIFLANESLQEEPKPIEYYLEEQKKRIDKTVNINMAPLENAKKKIAKILKRVKSLPKQIEQTKLQAMKKAPRMHYSLSEMEEKNLQGIDKARALVNKLEKQAQNMHAKWGHLAYIPLNTFDQIREKLDKTESKIKPIFSKARKSKEGISERVKIVKQEIKQSNKFIPKEHLKDLEKSLNIDVEKSLDIDIERPLWKQQDLTPWQEKGFSLVVTWRKLLEKNDKIKNQLIAVGFEDYTIKKAWLGLNAEEINEKNPDSWGLEEKNKDIVIPKGLVIPRFQHAKLIGFKIRKSIPISNQKDFLMPGSKLSPLFLPAVETENSPVIITDDELGAYLLEQEIGDVCCILALDDFEQIENLKDPIKKILENALSILLIVELKNFSKEDWLQWEDKFPKIKKLKYPVGDNLFDLPKNSIDIRDWIMEYLPIDFQKKHNVNISLPESGKLPNKSPLDDITLPIFNIKEIIKNFKEDIRAYHQPNINKILDKKASIEKESSETKKELYKKLKELGHDPETLLQESKSSKPESFSELGKEFSQSIKAQKEILKKQKTLTPHIEEKLDNSSRQALSLGQKAEKRYIEAKEKYAKAQEKIAKVKSGEAFEEFKNNLKSKGVDVDRLKKLSKEEVIERYKTNKDLSKTILSGLDLSDLDLEGANLTETICIETNFSRCNLKNSIFNKTIANKANFTNASLEKANIKKSLFNKAILTQTKLKDSKIYMSIFGEAKLAKTDLSEAIVKMSTFQKANLEEVIFCKSKLDKIAISKSNITKGNFARSKISKCIFQEDTLNNVNFTEVNLESTIFTNSKLEHISFNKSQLNNLRTAMGSELVESDFTQTKIENACFRNTVLNKANFKGSVIKGSIFEECDLTESDFFCVPAQNSRFVKCNLEKANLRGINLFQGSLRKSRLVETDLRDSNLFAVDFYKAIMGNTRIDGANIKRTFLEGRTIFLQDGEIK